jgi:hypothetical protein
MLWTAPPPAHRCHGCGALLRLPRFRGASHADDNDNQFRHPHANWGSARDQSEAIDTWVVFPAACRRRRATTLSDLAHKQVKSKKIVSGQRKGIVPRLTKGNGHD